MHNYQDITELLNLQDWQIINIRTNSDDTEVIFNLFKPSDLGHECSRCSTQVLFAYDRYNERMIRDFPVFGKKVFLSFSQSRVYCPKCDRIIAESIDWVDPYSRMSKRYEKYLASLCDYMTVTDVSKIEGINKDTLYKIDKKWLEWRKENRPNLNIVVHLGIDEIAIKKNHKYATVFYDLERSTVIGLVKGRKQRNVSSFFRKWGKENCNNVKAVCTDLWSAFHNSVKLYLKKAVLVFDKFHVFKYLSNAIEKVRREEQNKLDKEGRKIIKGCRWILLKSKHKRKEKLKLLELMSLNQSINKAILLKEEFRRFYDADDINDADKILSEWIEECYESNLEPFIKLGKRLNRWKEGILQYFNIKISNGISEGLNNKIKVIKRKSYGFHDTRYFFLKILKGTGFLPNMKEV